MSRTTQSTDSTKKKPRSSKKRAANDSASSSGNKHRKKRKTRVLKGPELPPTEKWGQWVQHLAGRSKPQELVHLTHHMRTHPLKWALPDTYEKLPAPKLLKQLTRLTNGRRFASAQAVSLLREWLGETSERSADGIFALECLGWAHALPRLGLLISESDWRELLEQLDEIVESGGGIALHDDPVTHQLLNAELPLTLAYLFPEIGQYKSMRKAATSALRFGTQELLDGEGLLNSRHVDRTRELLACWTRCSLMASTASWDCFDQESRTQYEWAVRQSLRLSRMDGSLVLSRGLSGGWCHDLLGNALQEGGDDCDTRIAEAMLPGAQTKLTDRQARKLPEPSVYSEWAEACVMRSKWSRKSPQFCCLFSDRELRTELTTGGRVIWSGSSNPTLQVDGQALTATSDWTELCWFTDEDVDYLELEVDFEGGWAIQRQMLLARRDDFLLLADAVLGPGESKIQYDHRLPLADDISFIPEEATHEGYLKNSRPLCTVLPLSLPEWRTAPTAGRLVMKDGQLQLSLSVTAARLYAPLLVDLSSRRWIEKRTWRQLTIAEHLEVQRTDIAAGFRVQLGRKQWLIYRSLGERANRTLLGQNLSQEFLVARFDSDGCIDELIEID